MDAIYLHVPFCFHKCHYCDFYSVEQTDPQRFARFTRRLIGELRFRVEQWGGDREKVGGQGAVDHPLEPRTVFVGGGTPTLLPAEHWRELLAAMRELRLLDAVTEFTVEANPETVTPELLDVLVAGGVNRLSIGAQSFQPELLKTLERWHEPANVGRAVAMARDAGIDNISLDLITAIPDQTLAMVDADLDAALSLMPRHLSCYTLIFEPNTALHQRMKLGKITPLPDDEEGAIYEHVQRRLDDAGFQQYEISNWARREADQEQPMDVPAFADGQAVPGYATVGRWQCLHNLVYWWNRNWLSFGPAGASHIEGHRWRNEPHIGRYLESREDAAPPTIDHERLDDDGRLGETLMLGLRLRRGIAMRWVEAHVPTGSDRRRAMDDLTRQGLLEIADDMLRLSDRGLLVGDRVIGALL